MKMAEAIYYSVMAGIALYATGFVIWCLAGIFLDSRRQPDDR